MASDQVQAIDVKLRQEQMALKALAFLWLAFMSRRIYSLYIGLRNLSAFCLFVLVRFRTRPQPCQGSVAALRPSERAQVLYSGGRLQK